MRLPSRLTSTICGPPRSGCIMQNFFGHPDCSKIATTQIVNQAEVFLRQNLATLKALPADQKTPATMFF
jgi:hypothetical protein